MGFTRLFLPYTCYISSTLMTKTGYKISDRDSRDIFVFVRILFTFSFFVCVKKLLCFFAYLLQMIGETWPQHLHLALQHKHGSVHVTSLQLDNWEVYFLSQSYCCFVSHSNKAELPTNVKFSVQGQIIQYFPYKKVFMRSLLKNSSTQGGENLNHS